MEKVTAIVDPHPESDQHQNLTILYGYLCSILQTLVDIPLRLPEVLANRRHKTAVERRSLTGELSLSSARPYS